MKQKIIYVKLYDHFTKDEIEEKELENIDPTICEVIGWIVKEDDKYIYLANWLSQDEHGKKVFDISGILKATIIEMKEINPKA